MRESLMVSLTAGTWKVPFIPHYKIITQLSSELELEQLYSQGTMEFRSVILRSSSSASSPHNKKLKTQQLWSYWDHSPVAGHVIKLKQGNLLKNHRLLHQSCTKPSETNQYL